MRTPTKSYSRYIVAGSMLLAGCHVAPAMASSGCVKRNLATYQIGQTTFVDVHNDIKPGTMVRAGEAAGEGQLLLVCGAGTVQVRGRWQGAVSEGAPYPLSVNGKPSGFGLRLYLKDDEGGEPKPFPHTFSRTFTEGEEVRSDQDIVRYEIYRTEGPVEFGAVDTGPIAQSNIDRQGGGMVVFRSMEIYDLVFRRPACSITSESLNQDVHVGDFNASNFATPDRATPWKEFRLTVEECLEPIGLVASFVFGGPSDADKDDPQLFSLSGPENVGLELGDPDKKTIEPGKEARFNAVGTGKDFVFNVRLRESKPTVRGGTFNRPITVRVDFM